MISTYILRAKFLFLLKYVRRKKNRCNLRLILIILLLIILLTLGYLIISLKNKEIARFLKIVLRKKYRHCPVKNTSSNMRRNNFPSRNMLYADSQGNSNIFMVETSDRFHLSARQACAIESAAFLHPLFQVTVFMTSPTIDYAHPIMESLLAFKNIRIKQLNLTSLFKGSPLFSWFEDSSWRQSPYKASHLSDALRYFLLWTYGGIYLDLDTIVLKPLHKLKNCSGLEDEIYVATGVMAFDKHHPFIGLCLDEFRHTYNGLQWNYNGPALFTRVLKHVCGDISDLGDVTKDRCMGVDILPTYSFYAIPWYRWQDYFDPLESNNVINELCDSYVIHMWNKLSASTPVIIGSGQAYELAAKNFCPAVYNIVSPLGEF